MDTVERKRPTHCAHCREPFLLALCSRGRTRVYCSDSCRKAAFEARRSKREGAVEVRVVERVVTREHDIRECVRRVEASPVAVRNVIYEVVRVESPIVV